MLSAFLCALGCILGRLTPVSSISQGYQLGDPVGGISVLFPLTVTQCDAVVVFYNVTTSDRVPVLLHPPDDGAAPFLTFTPPSGAGYLVWHCTVPAGSSFIASATRSRAFTVHAGPSSICLGDLSVDTAIARYDTSVFQSLTRRAYRASTAADDLPTACVLQHSARSVTNEITDRQPNSILDVTIPLSTITAKCVFFCYCSLH